MKFTSNEIAKLRMDIPLIFARAGPDPPDKTRARAQCRLAQGPPPERILETLKVDICKKQTT
ncbi:hypothetical protein [Kaarinaea lacus]